MCIHKAIIAALLTMTALPPANAGNWGKNSLWNDGRAEVIVYDSERIVYEGKRNFQEQLITVAEDLDEETLVKSDNPKKSKTIPVFKLNIIQKFETENYPYSYMVSMFVDKKNVRQVVKLTMSAQEWNGNTVKIYKKTGPLAGRLEWYSYFDGEADGAVDIQLKENDYFEDALPLSLRDLEFKEGEKINIRLWNSLMTNHAHKFEAVSATVTVVGQDLIRSRAGSKPSWKVTVEKPSGLDTYWFEQQYPHILTKMETKDGRQRLLYGQSRWKFWDRRLPMPNALK